MVSGRRRKRKAVGRLAVVALAVVTSVSLLVAAPWVNAAQPSAETDLAIEAAVSPPGSVDRGTQLTYAVSVSNVPLNQSGALNVWVSATLAPGLQSLVLPPGCSFVGARGFECAVGQLAPGEIVALAPLRATVRTDAIGDVTQRFRVEWREDNVRETDLTNNEASVTTGLNEPTSEFTTLTGTVFNDLNRDNLRQTGEPALSGAVVELTQAGTSRAAANRGIASAALNGQTTGTAGVFFFQVQGGLDYTLQAEVANYTCSGHKLVNVPSGTQLVVDLPCTSDRASISGVVFRETGPPPECNAYVLPFRLNDVYDSGCDLPLGRVVVRLSLGGVAVGESRSDGSTGRFSFTNLEPGRYTLTVPELVNVAYEAPLNVPVAVPPFGLIETLRVENESLTAGDLVTQPGDQSVIVEGRGPSLRVTVAAGAARIQNFGYQPVGQDAFFGTIGGLVWEQTTDQSSPNPGRNGLGGVRVTITGEDFDTRTVVTGGDGTFLETVPAPGVYSVAVDVASAGGLPLLTSPTYDGITFQAAGDTFLHADFAFGAGPVIEPPVTEPTVPPTTGTTIGPPITGTTPGTTGPPGTVDPRGTTCPDGSATPCDEEPLQCFGMDWWVCIVIAAVTAFLIWLLGCWRRLTVLIVALPGAGRPRRRRHDLPKDQHAMRPDRGYPDIRKRKRAKLLAEMIDASKAGPMALDDFQRKLQGRRLNRLRCKPDDIVRRLFLLQRGRQSWDSMFSLHERMHPQLRRATDIRQQHAFALNRAGRGDKAERELRALLSEEGASAETYGILGRVYKDRWHRAVETGDAELATAMLQATIDNYVRGFESSGRQTYPGINALTAMEINDPSDPRRGEILAVVAANLDERLAAEDVDYWDHATALELAVLQGDQAEAESIMPTLLAAFTDEWELETTLNNLRLLRIARSERGHDISWLMGLESMLEVAMK